MMRIGLASYRMRYGSTQVLFQVQRAASWLEGRKIQIKCDKSGQGFFNERNAQLV
jgi:hypothetical protein